jgi:glucose-6-phosphate isomerase
MLTLDFTNMMSEIIGGNGIDTNEINSLEERFYLIHSDIVERRIPELCFLDLVDQDIDEINAIAESIRNNSHYFLLLGIGGSALGPRAILEALKPHYNLKYSPKIFIYDNVDPATLNSILSIINPEKTTVNVISKSGSTVETMTSFLILMDILKKTLGEEYSKWVIATTDPEKGVLREIAEKEGFKTLPIHPHLVGRFSVLSPVGLLPAAVAGINIRGIVKGAKDIFSKCAEGDLWKNPAYICGALMYLMEEKKKKNISVILPYSDRLKAFSEWYCQLWAESLGKNNKGQTPYPSTGVTDQHSQLQLWMEGPRDKIITFIDIKDYGADFSISPEDIEALSYLQNHTLGELIRAEQQATELALAKAGMPSMRLRISTIDSYYIGQLFLFFELVTVITGMLHGINPFNQPGVEEGKNLTYGIMGREGYEIKAREVSEYRERRQKSKYRI